MGDLASEGAEGGQPLGLHGSEWPAAASVTNSGERSDNISPVVGGVVAVGAAGGTPEVIWLVQPVSFSGASIC